MATESAIQAKIIKYLESIGSYVVKVTVSNKRGRPDLICCLDGKFIAFEIKRGKKEIKGASLLQKWNLEQIQKAGGLSYIISSIEEANEIINQLRKTQ